MIDANECEAACLHNERDTELNPYNACVNLQKAAQPTFEKNAQGNNLEKLTLAELKTLVATSAILNQTRAIKHVPVETATWLVWYF